MATARLPVLFLSVVSMPLTILPQQESGTR